jgi:regulator of replication initiation timing
LKNRLDHLRRMIKTHRVFYSRYNPGADLLYDVEEADEDYNWMIHEIESLRLENERLKEFVAYTRREMEKELEQSGPQDPPPPRNRGKTNKKFKAK